MGKNKTKIFLLILCILMTIMSISPLTGFAAESTDQVKGEFYVETSWGYEGQVKGQRSTPVFMNIQNQGQDFEGQLKLILSGPNGTDNIAFMQEILIGAGSEKQYSFVVPGLSNGQAYKILLENSNGKTAYEKLEKASVTITNDLCIAILSDDFNSLNYLDRITLEYDNERKSSRIFNLSADQIPDTVQGLQMMDMLVISNFDTSVLSTEQYDTIKSWVNDGGILLLGTGSTYQKTLNIFQDDYVTGTINEMQKEELVYQLTEEGSLVDTEEDRSETQQEEETKADNNEDGNDNEAGNNNDTAANKYTITVDALDIQADNSVQSPGSPMQVLLKGNGKVIVFSIDMGSEPFTSWDYNNAYMEEYFSALFTDTELAKIFRDDIYYDYYYIQETISNIFDGELPKIGRYVFVLFVYIISILVLYFVLKFMDKRQLLWVCVPVSAMVFAGLVIVLSGNTRQKTPFINYSSVIELDEMGSYENTYFSATSPNNKDYQVTVPEAYALSSVQGYNYFYSSDTENELKNYTLGFHSGSGENRIEIKNKTAFNSQYFRGVKRTQTGTVDVDILYSENGYSGTVTNNTEYDLEDCGIVTAYSVVKVGTLNAGETVQVEELEVEGYNGLYTDQIANILFGLSSWYYSDTEPHVRTKAHLLSYGMEGNMSQDFVQVAFVGFADGFKTDLEETANYPVSGNTLFIQNAELSYKPGGRIKIPDISGLGEVISGDVWYYEGVYEFYSESAQIEYRLGDNLKIESITMESAVTLDSRIKIEIYNYEKKQYEAAFVDDNVIEDNIEQYLGDLNVIRILYTLDGYDQYNYEEFMLPIYSVTGKGLE